MTLSFFIVAMIVHPTIKNKQQQQTRTKIKKKPHKQKPTTKTKMLPAIHSALLLGSGALSS